MLDSILSHEPQLRLAIFLGVFALLLIAQKLRPRREINRDWQRLVTNIAMVIVGTVLLRVAFPLLAFELALRIEGDDRGLHALLPWWAAVVAGVIILDCAIYWQHRLIHMIPLFWRLHRVHHADTQFDVTTAVRFHPVEIALSMAIKLAIIALLGIPALAVLIFEILLSAGALFTHANLQLPERFERRLRWLFVTPEMHRIHHSIHPDETNSNFGFHLSLWDRLFRSYRSDPRDGQTTMQIGLKEFREPREQTLWAMLINPFRSV